MKTTPVKRFGVLRARVTLLMVDESGMSTVEYSTIKVYTDVVLTSDVSM